MSENAKIIISDSMEGFIRTIPEDLRKKLSLYDIDRIYRIFCEEWERLKRVNK